MYATNLFARDKNDKEDEICEKYCLNNTVVFFFEISARCVKRMLLMIYTAC